MKEEIKWEEVTTHDKLMDYIREVIGEQNRTMNCMKIYCMV